MKMKYTAPEIKVITFEAQDIITTSDIETEDIEIL
jgi:hypothetical protein